MPRTKISEFSATPASNTDIDSIFIGEGMAPSNVNDAIRELMAQLKDWQSGTSNDPYVVGSSGSLTLNQGTANGIAYLNGSKVVTSGTALVFDATNTALSVGGSATNTAANRGNISINGTSTAILSLSTGASAKGYVYHSGSDMIVNATTGTLALQANGNGALIDTSGNLGLGVTPSAWGSAFRSLDVRTSGAGFSASDDSASVNVNSYNNSGWKFKGTSIYRSSRYDQFDGSHQWFTGNTGTAGNAITFTQAMTLDASGNLLVGTTSAGGKFHVRGTAAANMTCRLEPYDNNYASKLLVSSQSSGDGGIQYGASGANNLDVFAYDAIKFSTGAISGSVGTERARIESSGNLLVGTTSNPNTARVYFRYDSLSTQPIINSATTVAASSSWNHFIGQSGNGSSITTNNIFILGNGNVQNANNSYGAISDIKLKENIVDASPKLDKLMQVRIRNYNLKGDYEQHKQIGVVAQELETVFPSMVDQTPDIDAEGNDLGTTTKSVKYSVFVPMLIKAMQEQQAIIESLKARLDAANL